MLLLPSTGWTGLAKHNMKDCIMKPCVCGFYTKGDVEEKYSDAISEKKCNAICRNCTFSTFIGNKSENLKSVLALRACLLFDMRLHAWIQWMRTPPINTLLFIHNILKTQIHRIKIKLSKSFNWCEGKISKDFNMQMMVYLAFWCPFYLFHLFGFLYSFTIHSRMEQEC